MNGGGGVGGPLGAYRDGVTTDEVWFYPSEGLWLREFSERAQIVLDVSGPYMKRGRVISG